MKRNWRLTATSLGLFLLACCFGAPAAQSAVDAGGLSNTPIEAAKKTPPPNIMFLLDDSGRMHQNYAMMDDYLGRAWLFARHDYNRVYYDPNRQYEPWPRPEKGAFLPRIPLSEITHAPNWPVIPAELSTCKTTSYTPKRLVEELRYEGRDGSTAATRDLTAPVTWYDIGGSKRQHEGFFPAATAIDLPASHYFVWHDVNGNGKGDGFSFAGTVIRPGEIDPGEIWLVALRYNGGAVQREFYEILGDVNGNGKLEGSELKFHADGDTAVPVWARAHWRRDDGSTYDPSPSEELDNFLQWYVYHSTKNFAALNALGAVLQQLAGVNVGIYSASSYGGGSPLLRIGVMPVKVGAADNTDYLFCRLYNHFRAKGNYPVIDAYDTVGRYFDMSRSDSFVAAGQGAKKPYLDADAGGSCQQSFVVNFVEGDWYTDPYAGGNLVGDLDGDRFANQLGDFAKYYYDRDLFPAAADQVPTTAYDQNSRQHLVTYSMFFGSDWGLTFGGVNIKPTDNDLYLAYVADPHFASHPAPDWSSSYYWWNPLFQAAVNGKGVFYYGLYPNSVDALAEALNAAAAAGVSADQEEGATAVAIGDNGQTNDNLTSYIGRYDLADNSGKLFAYRMNAGGEVNSGSGTERWEAAGKLLAKATSGRVIFTSNGDGTAVDFTSGGLASLLPAQRQIFEGGDPGVTFADKINWLRGQNDFVPLRRRGRPDDKSNNGGTNNGGTNNGNGNNGNGNNGNNGGTNNGNSGNNGGTNNGKSNADSNVMGDIIHSTPLPLRVAGSPTTEWGTVFVGANDGMLYAFNAKTGEDRFAFIPSQVHDHLMVLADKEYGKDPLKPHRYYVDGPMTVKRMAYMEGGVRKDSYLLVSGLGRGGRGYFALDVTKADAVNSFSSAASMLKWEYPRRSMLTTPADGPEGSISTVSNCSWHETDSNNPDGDGALYCAASGGSPQTLAYRDDDLGYSYGTPIITRTYRNMPSNGTDSWVVFFANGYGSKNGHAVLYALDAMTGKLLRKIDTGVGAAAPGLVNGLSTPAAIDVNDDDRTDFIYAGDLYGNLWKFDVQSKNPADWRVAHEDGSHRPQPLFTTAPPQSLPSDPVKIGQPITGRPNVMRHCKKLGYMVLFGTGQFLGEGDIQGAGAYQGQTLFGIWDNDSVRKTDDGIDNNKNGLIDEPQESELNPKKYLGAWVWDSGRRTYVNSGYSGFPGASLLKQEVTYQGQACENQAKDVNCRQVRVVSKNQPSWYDGERGDVGWFLNLPGADAVNTLTSGLRPSEPDANGNMATISERAVQDMIIRNQAAIAVTFIPNNNGCSSGGQSVLNELSACTGQGFTEVRLDLGDGRLNESDRFVISGGTTATASGVFMNGKVANPAFVGGVDGGKNAAEVKIMTGADGKIYTQVEATGGSRINYWREVGSH